MTPSRKTDSIQRIAKLAAVLVVNHVTGAAYFALPIAIAEIAFPLWLLFKGVSAQRWEQRASGASVPQLVPAAMGGTR